MKRFFLGIAALFVFIQGMVGAPLLATTALFRHYYAGQTERLMRLGAASYDHDSKIRHGGVLGPTCFAEIPIDPSTATLSYENGAVLLNGKPLSFTSRFDGTSVPIADWEYELARQFAAGMWVSHAAAADDMDDLSSFGIFYIKHPDIFEGPGYPALWGNRVFDFDFALGYFYDEAESILSGYLPPEKLALSWWNWQTNGVRVQERDNAYSLETDTRFFIYDETHEDYGYLEGFSDASWSEHPAQRALRLEFYTQGYRDTILSLEKINGLSSLMRTMGGLDPNTMTSYPDWQPDDGLLGIYASASERILSATASAPVSQGSEALTPGLVNKDFVDRYGEAGIAAVGRYLTEEMDAMTLMDELFIISPPTEEELAEMEQALMEYFELLESLYGEIE